MGCKNCCCFFFRAANTFGMPQSVCVNGILLSPLFFLFQPCQCCVRVRKRLLSRRISSWVTSRSWPPATNASSSRSVLSFFILVQEVLQLCVSHAGCVSGSKKRPMNHSCCTLEGCVLHMSDHSSNILANTLLIFENHSYME